MGLLHGALREVYSPSQIVPRHFVTCLITTQVTSIGQQRTSCACSHARGFCGFWRGLAAVHLAGHTMTVLKMQCNKRTDSAIAVCSCKTRALILPMYTCYAVEKSAHSTSTGRWLEVARWSMTVPGCSGCSSALIALWLLACPSRLSLPADTHIQQAIGRACPCSQCSFAQMLILSALQIPLSNPITS